eukprot:Skav203220  [mRNA]  locus=scaffold2292:184327:188471:+ [translate_table: standard]
MSQDEAPHLGSLAKLADWHRGSGGRVGVLLKKKGTEPGTMLAAGVTARISSILLIPAVAWLGDLQGIAWTLFLGSSMLTLLGVPLFVAMATNFMSFEAVVASYGLGYGFIFTFVGMIFFVYVPWKFAMLELG